MILISTIVIIALFVGLAFFFNLFNPKKRNAGTDERDKTV